MTNPNYMHAYARPFLNLLLMAKGLGQLNMHVEPHAPAFVALAASHGHAASAPRMSRAHPTSLAAVVRPTRPARI